MISDANQYQKAQEELRELEEWLAQAETVSSRAEDVQLGRHTGFTQGEIELNAVLRRHAAVFVGVKEESGRRVLRYLLLVGKTSHQFRRRVYAEQIRLRAAMGIL